MVDQLHAVDCPTIAKSGEVYSSNGRPNWLMTDKKERKNFSLGLPVLQRLLIIVVLIHHYQTMITKTEAYNLSQYFQTFCCSEDPLAWLKIAADPLERKKMFIYPFLPEL